MNAGDWLLLSLYLVQLVALVVQFGLIIWLLVRFYRWMHGASPDLDRGKHRELLEQCLCVLTKVNDELMVANDAFRRPPVWDAIEALKEELGRTSKAGDIKRISIAEFRELGLVHELNRQFLHPLGLALEVIVEDDGSERLGGIWDYRDDPEGILYGTLDREKMKSAEDFRARQHYKRKHACGFVVQKEDIPLVSDNSKSAIENSQ